MAQQELPKIGVTAPNPQAVASNALQSTPPRDHMMYKNRVQEYTQKAGLPLPVYQTVNVGAQHPPQFKSTVLVDGAYYSSPNVFSNRKAAEQDVAKFAYFALTEKIKSEAIPLIQEDTVFCKSILTEYGIKMNIEKATYTTIEQKGVLPIFYSSVVFNGVTYNGDAAKNKKDAEQLASRVAILSVLDSEAGMNMFEIIKSKRKLYSAMNMGKTSSANQEGTVPVGMQAGPAIPLSKGKEVEVIHAPIDHNMPITAVPAPSLGQPTNLPASYPPICEYRNPNPVVSYEASVTPPIVFVPPVGDTTLPLGSSAGKKRNKNKKKKAQKKMRVESQLPVAVMPLSQVPPCSVGQ